MREKLQKPLVKAVSDHSLRELQEFMANSIFRPLTADYAMKRSWIDGSDMERKAAEFVAPGRTLTSFQRLEIYNQQYWYRLLDCFEEDFPGLLSILGRKKFNKLAKAYLTECPSRSYSLRDLGCSLVPFLEKNRNLLSPNVDLCLDMARFEWAQVIAFDEESLPHLTPEQLSDPESVKMRLQPYISLLDLAYPLDDYSLAIAKESSQRSYEASSCRKKSKKNAHVSLPDRIGTTVAVHRFENMLYYKRLDPRAFVLLSSLAAGKTLSVACGDMLEWCELHDAETDDLGENVKNWFSNWTRLGWLCQPRIESG